MNVLNNDSTVFDSYLLKQKLKPNAIYFNVMFPIHNRRTTLIHF